MSDWRVDVDGDDATLMPGLHGMARLTDVWSCVLGKLQVQQHVRVRQVHQMVPSGY